MTNSTPNLGPERDPLNEPWSSEIEKSLSTADSEAGSDDRLRPHYRPPIGIPLGKQRRAASFAIAVLLHLAVIGLLLLPFASSEAFRAALGAGGIGPAGGGGGGSKGASGRGLGGAKQERLDYVRIAEPPPPAPKPVPEAPKPTITPPPVLPKPEVTPPPIQPKEPVVVPPADAGTETGTAAATSAGDTGAGTGSGGGTGTGVGPGSGGGSGSGSGTGRGSGVGSGTGGGMGTAYPPTPTELFLPPLPVPSKARGTIVVEFDVDSTGKVLDLFFEPTKDGKYNKKLREALAAIRFRPAVSAQGLPIRARTQITYSL